MGTKLYFRDAVRCAGPTSEQTSWTPNVNASGYDYPRQMGEGKGGSQVETSVILDSGQYGYHRVFVSSILAAQALPAQTITIAVATKPHMYFSAFIIYVGYGIYVWRNGANVATIASNALFHNGVPYSESELGTTTSSTSSEVSIQAGDRICVEIWHHRTNIFLTGPDYYFYYGGAIDPQNGVEITSSASYLQFGTTTLQYIDDTRAGVAAY